MVDNVKDAPERTLAYLLGVDADGKGGKQAASDFAGGGGGGGTVTSVGLTVPTGFSIASSPVTSSGTMVLSYASGYQGYTDEEAAKLGNIAVTGSVDLDAVKTKTGFLTVTDATDIDVLRTTVGYLTVTGAVDLDAINARVIALDAAVVLKGTWDASSGAFPGGGSAQAGESWIVATGGTVDGVEFTANDRIFAIADNASTSTFAGNWFKADYTDAVLSINGQTGAVTIQSIIHAASGKSTPANDDEFLLVDSAASWGLKKLTWANIKATLKTYFDTLYQAADAAIARLNVAQAWTKGQRATPVTLAITGGATAAWQLIDSNVFKLPLDGNVELTLPSDIATCVDQPFFLVVTQDGTGGHDLALASGYAFANGASFDVAQGANARTLISAYVLDGSTIVLGAIGAGVAL